MIIDERISKYIESKLLTGCSLVSMSIKEIKKHSPTEPSAYLDVKFKNEKGLEMTYRYNYLKLLRLIKQEGKYGC